MGRLVEALVVVDAEREAARLRDRCAHAADLRIEEPRGDRRHGHARCQALHLGQRAGEREAGDFRVVPLDGKRDRRRAQHAEVVRVVGVLGDVIAAQHEVAADALRQAGVELIAEARVEGCRGAEAELRREQGGDYRVRSSRCLKAPGFR